MRILDLNLNNFFSFKQANFDFRDKSDLIFVSGINGAGKSALFVEAIPWALYGNTIREKVYGSTSREFSKDDVVNLSAGKDCCVSVLFSVNGKTYTILRYRKHSNYGNEVRLLAEEGNISGESTKETNEKIVDLIGLNYSAYCNAVVYGQGTVKRFTQCTDAERRKILEDFLQLEIYTQAREVAKQDWKRLLKAIAALKTDRDMNEARLSEISRQTDRAKEHLKLKRSELKNYDASVRESIQSKNSRLKEIKQEQKHIDTQLKQHGEDEPQLDAVLQDIKESRKDFPDLSTAEEEYYKVRSTVDQLEQTIKKCEEKLHRFSLGDECPACFRKFTKAAFIKYQEYLNSEIAQSRTEYLSLRDDYLKSESIVERLRQLQEKEVAMTSMKQELDRKRTNGEASRKSLKEETKRIKTEISGTEDRSGDLASYVSVAKEEVRRLKKRTSIIEKVQKVKQRQINETQSQVEAANFWITGFSAKGVKDLIFAQSLGFLNDQLLRYSNAISQGEMHVEIKRDLSVGVDITEGAKRYQTASGGQAKRIDLMIGLALQSLVEAGWQDVNVKFIDEFDASLDKAGVDGFLTLLREEAKNKGAIFIISHNDYLADQIDNVIYVEINHGESTFITEGV